MVATPPYTDPARVRALVSRNADANPGTAGSVQAATIELAIDSARSIIDSKLSTLYVVPFNPVPRLVQDIATAFAAFDADMTFREIRDYSSELNPVYLRYKQMSALLDQLQAGKATLPDYEPPDPDPGPDDPPGGDVVAVFNPDLCAIDQSWQGRHCTDWTQQYYYYGG